MAAFLLRTRGSLFAHPLRRARPSSVHLHAGTKYRIGYRANLPWCDHVLTTESIVVPPISFRSFGVASNLSAVDPTTFALVYGAQYGVKKGADYVAETFKSSVGIKILPSKPHHAYLPKEQEIKDIEAKFDKLYKDHGDSVLGVYVRGGPASGKTQLAREFGEWYYRKLTRDSPESRNIGGTSGNKAVVATLDARTPASFLRSYLRLAEDLGFSLNRYNMAGSIQDRIQNISIDVQKALAGTAPNWLLIIDGIDPGCFRRFYLSLPRPGDDDWGQGRILVASRYDGIIPYSNDCAEHYTMRLISEADAVSLLNEVSGYKGEGAEEVVNSHYVGKMPLDVASAGIFIKKAREGDPNFTYETYLGKIEEISELLENDAQKHDTTSGGYAYSTTVFTILALCAHEPLPMSTFKQFLAAQPNAASRIQAIKDCDLLTFLPEQEKPTDSYDEVERVYLYKHTHKALKSMFIGGDHGSAALVKKNQELVKTFAECLLEEYEKATTTHPNDPQWMKRLLLPHLEELHQKIKAHSFDQNLHIQLCVILSNAYIELNKDPEKACNLLEELLAELKEETIHPHPEAKIHLGLGKAYRYLGEYHRSTESLTKALSKKNHLEELEVADILKELSATVSSYGEYTQSREKLEEALKLYEKHVDKPEHGPKSPVAAEALSSLAYLSYKLGEWDKGQGYLEKAEHELELSSKGLCSLDSSMHTAIQNLATAYMEIGEHRESIKLLDHIVKKEQDSAQQHTALAVPLAKLSVAHYYSGEWERSAEVAKEILQHEKALPWEALQILGAIVHDFGDISRARRDGLLDKIAKHSTTLAGKLLLGKVHRQVGNINEAQRILETLIRESEQRYGENHIYVGKALTELGKVYLEQDFRIKALEAFEQSYRIHKDFYSGQDHPDVAFALADLAKMVQHAGDIEHGAELMTKAMNVLDKHINNPSIKDKRTIVHIKYAQMLSNYGLILREKGELHQAQQVLVEALELQEKCLHENSIMTVRSLYNLGTVYHRCGQYDDAENMQTALDRMNLVESNHPYKATIATGMARLMVNRGDTSRAQSDLKIAINIRSDTTKCCGETHHKVAYAYETLGNIALSEGNARDAYEYFMDAFAVRVRLIERETGQKADFQTKLLKPNNMKFIEEWNDHCQNIRKKLLDCCCPDIQH